MQYLHNHVTTNPNNTLQFHGKNINNTVVNFNLSELYDLPLKRLFDYKNYLQKICQDYSKPVINQHSEKCNSEDFSVQVKLANYTYFQMEKLLQVVDDATRYHDIINDCVSIIYSYLVI